MTLSSLTLEMYLHGVPLVFTVSAFIAFFIRRGVTPARALKSYNAALAESPRTTNVATGATVMLLGDLMCQWFMGSFDASRAAAALVIGALWQGICVGAIFAGVRKFADRLVGRRAPRGSWLDVAVCTFLMECCLSTVGNYCNITARRLAAGGVSDPGEAFRQINERWATVLKVDWVVWPPYLIAAFALVPEEHRPASAAVYNSLWGVFISWMSS